jgi:serine/tyrosine/threonine adenylyltransferase
VPHGSPKDAHRVQGEPGTSLSHGSPKDAHRVQGEPGTSLSHGWNFDTSYLNLPGVFYQTAQPIAVALPQLVLFNSALAGELGLNAEALGHESSALIFSGNQLPEGATPIAQAYAGHQFGHFTVLGDGRAILLGEQIAPNNSRWDIQLKGPGKTPYSRRGDGRAALGPMLREYIISEAMHALEIPTTRSLAVVATGEPVYRDNVLPGAVLTRVAASHIRVGTFEFAASQGWLRAGTGKDALGVPATSAGAESRALSAVEGQGGTSAVKALADYTIARHYPECRNAENPYLAFFQAVAKRQAQLIAKWMQVGFIHGVMNTDNMALSGETIDYGPCAFMDAYDPATVFSSIDQHGRYAFANQPRIASWNLARLAEAMLPLFADDEQAAIALAQQALVDFGESFNRHWLSGMRKKLGLINEEDADSELVTALLSLMQQHQADYTNTFRRLSGSASASAENHGTPANALPGTETLFATAEFTAWAGNWWARVKRQSISPTEALANMRAVNPAVIARNHKVEEALKTAENGDMSLTHALLAEVQQPYLETAENASYREGAPQSAGPYRTFCGT